MPGEDKVFVFDCVLGEDSTQRDVYERAARPIVQDMLEGFNASIFAYGTHIHMGPTVGEVDGDRRFHMFWCV